MAARLPPPTPPRLTGDKETDGKALAQWSNAWFQNAMNDTGLIDPARQYVPATFDPDNLPDPTDSSIANAQQTANEAFTRGAVGVAAAQETASEALTTSQTAQTNAASALTTAGEASDLAELGVGMTEALTDVVNARLPIRCVTATISDTDDFVIISFPNLGASVLAFFSVKSVTGTPASGAYIVQHYTNTMTLLSLQLTAAPGAGTSITYNVLLVPFYAPT